MTLQPALESADPSRFFVIGDAPLAHVDVVKAVVILHEPVHLAVVGHAVPTLPKSRTESES